MNKKLFRIVLGLAIGMLLVGQVHAGSRLKLLLRNVVKLKNATLVVMPILPDSVQMAKLEAKGDQQKIDQYLDHIAQANLNMREQLVQEYDFSAYQFVPDSIQIRTWADYRAYLTNLKQETHYILQFGYASQYAGHFYKKLSKYDRDFLGVYEADGITRVYLNQGKADLFWQPHYALGVLENLNGNLNRYHKQAKKEGVVVQKKPSKS